MKKFMLILVMMAAAAPLYAAQGDLATFGIALGAGLAISLAALGGLPRGDPHRPHMDATHVPSN